MAVDARRMVHEASHARQRLVELSEWHSIFL
jgi:hypothetical protein